MYRNAMLSALMLYEYDKTVFDLLETPTEPAGLDRQTVIDSILFQTAELSLATCTSPQMLKNMVGLWSAKNKRVWQKLWETENFEYTPIWNKDGWRESQVDFDGDHNEILNTDITDDFTRNLHDAGTGTNTHSNAAFNNGMSEAEKDVGSNTLDQTGTTNNIHKDRGNRLNTMDDVTREKTHEYGNIGVTSTQSLIAEERETVQFNTIQFIVESFKNEFCTLVY